MIKSPTQKQLSWEDVRGFTPMLFVHRDTASPPTVARRLWAAISVCKLNQFETDVERSRALSILKTLALVFQEFRSLVFRQRMWNPKSIIEYLGIPAQHIQQIILDFKVSPQSKGASLDNILLLYSMNRDCVYDAIVDHFPKRDLESPDSFDRDGVFRLFAFPVGLSREETEMPLFELIEKKAAGAGLDCTQKMVANFEWKRGFELIDSRFARTTEYE